MTPAPGRWARAVAGAAGLAVLAGACVPPPPPQQPSTDVQVLEQELDLPVPTARSVLRQARQVTVRIRSLGCESLGVGSGFVLPGGLVVTNRHVVSEPRDVTLNTWDGRSLEASVDGVAVDSDLAVLSLAGDVDLPEARLRTEPPEVGEPVVAVGYPGGGPATVTTGTVLGTVDEEVLGERAGVVVVDAPIRPGNSGGPLLDEQGAVVGVVFALDRVTGNGLAVPVTTLLDRLETGAFTGPSGTCS